MSGGAPTKKRGNPSTMAPGSKKKRKYKAYISSLASLKGISGILIFSERGREEASCRELTRILNDQASSDDEDDEEEEDEDEDVEAKVKRELEALQTSSKTPKLKYSVLDIDCLSVLHPVPDPLAFVVAKLFREKIQAEQSRIPYVLRAFPAQRFVHASIQEICAEARAQLAGRLTLIGETSPSHPGATFAVSLRSRSCTEIDESKTGLINALAELVDQTQHKVSLGEPDVLICVEACKNIAGVTVCSGIEFRETCKFNVRLALEKATGLTDDQSREKQEVAAAPASKE